VTLGDGFPAASGTVDSTELRKSLAGLILRNTAGAARPGVFMRHTNALVTSRGDMKVDVAAFEGIAVRNGGVIFLANDGTVQVTISAAPGSNSRLTVVWFRQDESALGDGDNLPVLGTTDGTAAASPSKPSIPAGATELATLLIPAGAASTNAVGVTITNTFAYTTVAGVPIPVHAPADLAVTTGDAAMNLYPTGQFAFDISTGITYRWNGTTWKGWESDWITFTPTITNLVVGTGGSASSVWAYKFVAGDVKVKFSLVLGTSGASVSGIPTITLPVARAALAHAYEGTTGFLVLYDTANTRPYQGAILAENTDATKVRLVPTNSGALTTAIAAGVPFTWVPGSAASGELSYKAA
jgi:hypothetical protein